MSAMFSKDWDASIGVKRLNKVGNAAPRIKKDRIQR